MWTQEALDFVQTRWFAGLSASQISRLLYADLRMRKSRNAVIGVIHRKGWNRSAPIRKPQPQKAKRAMKATAKARGLVPPKMPAAPVEPEALQPIDPTLGVLGLNDMVCKWGIGDPKEPGFAFCGRTVSCVDSRWCAPHCKLVYAPTVRRAKPSELERLAAFLDRRATIQAKAA